MFVKQENHASDDARNGPNGHDSRVDPAVPANPTTGDLMFRVVRRLRRDFASATEPLGLNPHQVRALQVVDRGDEAAAEASDQVHGARPSTIAERLHITPRSATDVIDALQSKGYVTKAPDPHDRRAVRVHLTDEGRSVLRTADADREKLHSALFHVLNDDELSQLNALLRRLVEA